MFSLGSFTSRRPPDAWRLVLGFHHESLGQQEREVGWVAGEPEAAVLSALGDRLADPGLVHEAVHVTLHTASGPLLGVVAAAGFGAPVRLALTVRETRSRLVGVELARTSGTAALPTSLALALWQELEAASVTRLRVADAGAVAALADARVAARFTALRVLNLSHAGLTALPASVCQLTGLEELRVVGNQLRILPPEIGQLTSLRVLAADFNQLTILPGELRRCEQLEELTLQHNRLTSVLLSFASLRHLSVLHLYDNPLDFLPEISPCSELTHLTVANLRITADQAYTKFKVEFLPPPPGGSSSYSAISLWDSKQSDRLRPIFALMLRRSSGHHPLLAGALRQLADEDPKNRELMARQENGLQQLVLMALGDNPVVVEETCRTLALLARHSPTLADAVVANDADALLRLLPAADERRALATLGLLAALAHSSSDASARLATDALLACLARMVGCEGGGGEVGGGSAPAAAPGEEVRTAALKALGNLAFCDENRQRLERRPALMQRLSQLSLSTCEEPTRVQVAALRVLAILGENELVERAAGRPPIQGRGVRILSLDGGGMKGMATVRLLRELERHTGKCVWELFDLIVGTSTGGLLAVALGLLKLDMDACDHIYKVLGRKVFSRVVATKDSKEESWMESFYRTFQSKTSHVRAVVVGYKHDAAVYESLLREYCDFSKEERCIGDTMIDTAVLGPKVALVSTLSSLSPAPPFLFRTYQLPHGSEALAAQIGAHAGSCKHPVWQAVRASSAASFYLEDFTCGGDKFQDGAVTANNPAIIALQEARLLWPDHPIDVLMSVGVGVSPAGRRDKGLSSFMETGSILIESATNVTRADEALSTLMPLIPGVKYLRFCACDPRCNMELDEVDPERWAQLEAATEEYVASPATQAQFAEAAAALLQDRAASDVEPLQGSLKLGAHRKLVVLRAPRLGAQQLSVDDGVAASLAFRPGCAAVVDLQRLEVLPYDAPAAGSTAELGPQSAAPRSSCDVQQQHTEAAVAAAGAGPGEPPGDAGSQQARSSEDGGGFSAYISSWFSSPTKQSKLAAPPAGDGASSGQQQQQSQQQPSQASQPSVASRGASPARPAFMPAVAAGPAQQAGSSSAASSAAGAESLAARLEEQLAAVLPSVGVVHLGLELSGAAGLVLRWQQRLQAVAEPSEQASALLLAAGLDPHCARLVDVFAQQPSLQLPGGRSVSVLSSQSQWDNGRALSMLLLSLAGPDVVLPASSLVSLSQLLRKRLVVCTAALPKDYIDAMLDLGAKGIVSRAAESSSMGLPASTEDSCTFFSAFYDALLAGKAVSDSLLAAADAVPVLKGMYVLHTR